MNSNDFEKENQELADQYAESDTLKYLLLRLGFMPHDEEDAIQLRKSILEDPEDLGLADEEMESIKEWK